MTCVQLHKLHHWWSLPFAALPVVPVHWQCGQSLKTQCPRGKHRLLPVALWPPKYMQINVYKGTCTCAWSNQLIVNNKRAAHNPLEAFKAAYTLLLVKKSDMDPADTRSYRPIFNLSVVSKVLKRIVAHQLLAYLDGSGLLPRLQSAYRTNHCTETAVLKVL